MIKTELRLFNLVLIIFLLIISTKKISIDAAAVRCYLCSQNTLAECVGSIQSDSLNFHTLIQHYTEPCNGQCVLFRRDKSSTVRGCSWTYGHMTPKPTGWHELSPGIQAYFCDSYLCNNGTIEQPNTPMIKTGANDDEIISSSDVPGNSPSVKQTNLDDQASSPSINNELSDSLRQCYICTARLTGCSEYLDPRYTAKYIQPCSSSCVIFRNPTDHNLITRDCATSWPQVHAKSGLHKLLGSDAFFCQESLCNGINFDFIIGIFHNQLPAVIKFSSNPINEPTVTTTIATTPKITSTPPFHPMFVTMINPDEDNVIWEDPDLDFVVVEPTKPTTTTVIPMTSSTTFPFPTEFPEDIEIIDESSTIPFEHFDFLDNNLASSTIAGGMAVAEQDFNFNWWDIDEASFAPPIDSSTSTIPNNFPIITSTIKLPHLDEDDWSIFNTTSSPAVTQTEHASDVNPDIDFDFNDYFLFPLLSTTPTINLLNNNNTLPIVPFHFNNHKPKDQFYDLIKPNPTLDTPPFTWMLNLATQNKARKSLINQPIPSTTTTVLTTIKQKNKKSSQNNLDYFSEYCNKKQCQNGGRLNADCLCICLPAFSGHNCEKVNCDQEPAHICDFVLEHECKSDYVRYLCPKFCQMNICSSNRSS